MNKYKIAKIVNAIICITLIVVIMRIAYNEWSLYNLSSFFVSLFVHGFWGIVVYLGIDWILRKFLK